MRMRHGLFAIMAAAAASLAVFGSAQPNIKSSGPQVHRRAPKPPRTPDPKAGAKMRKTNAKKGVGTARVCPTMRAIEERRRAKMAASEMKAAA